jgi:hypothetical protein
MREPHNEVLPFVWAKAIDSGVRQLAWLTLDGKALADGTRKLALVLTKAEATLAGLGAKVNPKADDNEAFKRGVRFGETGWDAAVDEQFRNGDLSCLAGNAFCGHNALALMASATSAKLRSIP